MEPNDWSQSGHKGIVVRDGNIRSTASLRLWTALEAKLSEFERTFSLDEARDILPWLRECFDAIRPMLDDLEGTKLRVRTLLSRLQSNGGPGADQELGEATRVLHRTQEQIDERLYAVTERGILVRSVEHGLVDFPSVRDGRVVFLCWLADESDITHWHAVDTGFAGRQPL